MSTIASTHDADGYPIYDTGRDLATCNTCGRTWDDSIVTSMTPAPSARCPFEYFHDSEEIPDDWPVKEEPDWVDSHVLDYTRDQMTANDV